MLTFLLSNAKEQDMPKWRADGWQMLSLYMLLTPMSPNKLKIGLPIRNTQCG